MGVGGQTIKSSVSLVDCVGAGVRSGDDVDYEGSSVAWRGWDLLRGIQPAELKEVLPLISCPDFSHCDGLSATELNGDEGK